MATKSYARCSVYDKRPLFCQIYPTVSHWIPSECTFYFQGEERHGECACGIGACCAVPRVGGEPGGAAMMEISGGEPCKYLEWFEEETEDGEPLVTGKDLSEEDLSGEEE